MPGASSSSDNSYEDSLNGLSDNEFAYLVLALKFDDAAFRVEAMSHHRFRLCGGHADRGWYENFRQDLLDATEDEQRLADENFLSHWTKVQDNDYTGGFGHVETVAKHHGPLFDELLQRGPSGDGDAFGTYATANNKATISEIKELMIYVSGVEIAAALKAERDEQQLMLDQAANLPPADRPVPAGRRRGGGRGGRVAQASRAAHRQRAVVPIYAWSPVGEVVRNARAALWITHGEVAAEQATDWELMQATLPPVCRFRVRANDGEAVLKHAGAGGDGGDELFDNDVVPYLDIIKIVQRIQGCSVGSSRPTTLTLGCVETIYDAARAVLIELRRDGQPTPPNLLRAVATMTIRSAALRNAIETGASEPMDAVGGRTTCLDSDGKHDLAEFAKRFNLSVRHRSAGSWMEARRPAAPALYAPSTHRPHPAPSTPTHMQCRGSILTKQGAQCRRRKFRSRQRHHATRTHRDTCLHATTAPVCGAAAATAAQQRASPSLLGATT